MNQFSHSQDSACLEVQDTLEAYLADALDADTHEQIAAHIASCPMCQDEVRFAQTISEALQELPRPEPPPGIFNAVAAYVRAHPAPNQQWWYRIFQLPTFWDDLKLTFVHVGAFVCLVGIVLFGMYQYQQHLKTIQASRDLIYALSKLNYAVEKTSIFINRKQPDIQMDEVSRRPFAQIEAASYRTLKQKQDISSAIHRGLDRLNDQFRASPYTENHQSSDPKQPRQGNTQ